MKCTAKHYQQSA